MGMYCIGLCAILVVVHTTIPNKSTRLVTGTQACLLYTNNYVKDVVLLLHHMYMGCFFFCKC